MADNTSYVLHDTKIIKSAMEKKGDLVTRYDNIVGEYKDIISNLLANWQGYGADAFREDATKVGSNINGIYNILKTMSDTLDDCVTVLEQIDAAMEEYNSNPT